ncbi:hypothetical protein [Nocardia sp. BMG111209]|uniref:hypothetical protein n=1 Tax=Nocardia sp. BMG111209 TaxID=1160137 RepID=UPI0003641641|nr:hypothetical protein [Nocardia sp. BMG111209]
MRISHIAAVLVSMAAATGVAAATANAETVVAPPSSVAAARPVDAMDDYESAIADEQNQENAAAASAGLAGAAIGVVPGCVFGALTGVALPPIELVTIPVGCLSGALVGAGIAAGIATSNIESADEPGIWQKCLDAMPVWACQIQQQQREQAHDNDDD